MAGAIVLETLAFIIWNVGTRSPVALLHDVAASLTDPRKMFAGTVIFVIGAIFIAAATVLLLPAIANFYTDFLPTELFTLLVALAIEHLIGNDVRALTGTRI